MPRNLSSSPFMRPLVVLALPGMYLFYKYSQYKRQQQEQNRRRVTERELAHLNHKIDKLLSKLEENEPELATCQEDECVICVNAKATMQTSPCGHRVVCRKCFVKTIQMAVSQRLLPLRCVICRAKILRLKASGRLVTSASHYSMGPVPNSESLYSMSSGSSSLSGVSSSSGTSSCSGKSQRSYRQPSGSLRKSQTHSMKYHLQEYKEPRPSSEKTTRLPPIQEFQREYRLGKERSSSTRIRCAQKIVTQLETTPLISGKQTSFFRASSSRDRDARTRSVEKVDTKQSKLSSTKEPTTSTPAVQPESKKADKSKQDKKEKAKEKELSKAEKKEQKKEAKAEKKNAKKEAKNEKKDKKETSDTKKQ